MRARKCLQSRLLLRGGHCRAAIAKYLEEFAGGRVKHHDITLIGEGRLVGIQAAVKLRELRIFAKCFSIQARSFSITLPFDFLRIAVSIGNGDFALTVSIGTGAPARMEMVTSNSTTNGSRPSIQADIRPSADITRTCASSLRRARISRLILPSTSARLPPDSRCISTAMTR